MRPFSMDCDAVLAELYGNKDGLTSREAEKRRIRYGENKLKEKKKRSAIARFLDQFKDVMIIILLIAAAVSFVLAIYEKDGAAYFEPILILVIVVLNAVMGMVQESKAERALEALSRMSAPKARVLRDGKEQVLDAAQLVPGDIIFLEAGDYVPADGRLLSSNSLKSEESALTGESVPAEKDALAIVEENAPLGDRINMVHSGCSVTYGTGRAVVTATGMDTEMGKIAGLLHTSADTGTPLQRKLAKMGKYLGFLALGACAVIFIIGLIDGMDLMEMFMTSVSLAVSAIPEGLPAIVTIVLAIGVQRMVKRNAIIRRLPAVETLGSASVICSDKTGTLTQNRMTLVKAVSAENFAVENIGHDNSAAVRALLKYAALCCDGAVTFTEQGEKHVGDPTETAIIVAAHKNGMEKSLLLKECPRLAELPFDSDRKLMSTIHEINGRKLVIVKGAVDVMAARCISGDVERGKALAEKMGEDALRVLAIGYREIAEIPEKLIPEEIEAELTFMGLVGMIDPPREEAREAVAVCRQAGIRPVMITGDHVITASAIARQLGILTEGDDAITGTELATMGEEELMNRVTSISVYARVSPEDKIRIVRAWQAQGAVVAMTGDGVNDAPALKAADIGCAMGITGTDVAKGAADMTLTDDNFATIVEAVKEGRGIYDNIKKAVAFLLGTNIGELLTVFVSMLLWQESPLLSMQLLWINFVTDSLPAIALGMEPVENDVMRRLPKPKDESIFAGGLGIRIGLQGVMFAILTLIAFRIGCAHGGLGEGRTMAFLTLALSQVIHAFNMRSEHSIFKIGVFSNQYLNGAAALSTLLIGAVAFIPPVASVFGLALLPVWLYLAALGLALVPVAILEAAKLAGLVRHHSRNA